MVSCINLFIHIRRIGTSRNPAHSHFSEKNTLFAMFFFSLSFKLSLSICDSIVNHWANVLRALREKHFFFYLFAIVFDICIFFSLAYYYDLDQFIWSRCFFSFHFIRFYYCHHHHQHRHIDTHTHIWTRHRLWESEWDGNVRLVIGKPGVLSKDQYLKIYHTFSNTQFTDGTEAPNTFNGT